MASIFADPGAKGKNFQVLPKYLGLDQCGKVQVEYIWIGGSGLDLRAKTRTLPKKVTDVKEIPAWNYDVRKSPKFPPSPMPNAMIINLH